MSDEETPEKRRQAFRIVSGGLDVGTPGAVPPELAGKTFTWEDLEGMDITILFNQTGDKTAQLEEITIDGQTYYMEPVPEPKPDFQVYVDKENDTFIFIEEPPKPKY